MPLKKLKTLSTNSIHKNPYWEYRLDSYTLPDGSRGDYHYVHTQGAVMTIAVDRDGKLILVKQFRYLSKRESLEFPGGGVKNGDFLATAKNELAEEASVGAADWDQVGEFNPYNGITDETCRIYLATDLEEAARQKDASEEFEVLRLTVNEIQSLVDEGEIWDGMTLAAWAVARERVLHRLKETKQ